MPPAPPVSTTPDDVWAVGPGDCPPTLLGAGVAPESLVEPEPLEPEPSGVEPFVGEPLAEGPFAREPFAGELFAGEPFATEPFEDEPLAPDPLQLMVTCPLPPLMVPVLTPAVSVGEVTDAAA